MKNINFAEAVSVSGGRSPEVSIDPVTGEVVITTCTEQR